MKNNLLNIFGLGRTKFSASTASLLVLPIYWTIYRFLPWSLYVNLLLFFIVLTYSMLLLNKNKAWAISDPKEVVVDELLGMHASLIIACTQDIAMMAAQFILFRVIDIIKPFPFSWIEKKCKNQYGLLVDDIAIGIFIGCIFVCYSYLA